jgi:preprotein translocase subunit Sec63
MTDNEILSVIGGLIVGYLIVTTLINKIMPDKKSSAKNKIFDEYENEYKWHEILEVKYDASIEEISLAYKKKISQYHPDKVSKMGIEIRELAEIKTKEINAAYDFAMRLKK